MAWKLLSRGKWDKLVRATGIYFQKFAALMLVNRQCTACSYPNLPVTSDATM